MKLLLLISITFLSLTTLAQEKYIEVVVKDTILVDPDTWSYRFTVSSSQESNIFLRSDTFPPKRNKPDMKEESKKKLKTAGELRTLAINNGGMIADETKMQDYSVESEANFYRDITVGVIFNKRSNLESFMSKVKEYKNVSGYIYSINNSNPEL